MELPQTTSKPRGHISRRRCKGRIKAAAGDKQQSKGHDMSAVMRMTTAAHNNETIIK